MGQPVWKVNGLEYFEAPAASALMFHDVYPDGRQSGIEIIQHGERVLANGDFRLSGWRFSEVGKRTVYDHKRAVKVECRYEKEGIDYAVRVEAEGPSLRVHLDLARPLPASAGGAAFTLDLFPPAYWGKTFHFDDRVGIFPRQDNGTVEVLPDGGTLLAPLGTGSTLTVAPEDPMRRMTIARVGGEMELVNGQWFKVRAPVAVGAAENAVELVITPNQVRGWRRPPVIGISQVGYHPDQRKCAVIELDPKGPTGGEAELLRVAPDGTMQPVLSAAPTPWGKFLRYQYALFDFTAVRGPGAYVVRYRSQQTPPFRIASDVYQRDVWQPTLESYLAVQMCHVAVFSNQGLVWHGLCHMDDALQAPAPLVYLDSYAQGPTTETPYQADQHIPGLNQGGWHDAGDDDLAAGAQAETTLWLALARETFGVGSDQTTIDQTKHLVLLHTPDGVPDLLQQVAHGASCLLGGYRAAGHSFSGIIHSSERQRISGDWASLTDGRTYDPSLGLDEVAGERSGRHDDRWVFTSRDTSLEYKVAQALAAASRVLRGYEDALAQECLETAQHAWEYEQVHEPVAFDSAYVPGHPEVQEVVATAELLITTGEERYRQRLLALRPRIVSLISESPRGVHTCAWAVVRALPHLKDEALAQAVREAVAAQRANVEADISQNPYRIPWHPHLWGVGGDVQPYACEQYFLVKALPQLFDRELVLSVVNYVLGCHPGSSISLACGVGAHSLTSEYSYLRPHWYYTPGAVVPGTALIGPDFPELKDNFPFLWTQSEDAIAGAATYIFAVLAAEDLLNGEERVQHRAGCSTRPDLHQHSYESASR